MKPYQPDLASLEQQTSHHLLCRSIGGSFAYGTHHENSDRDIRGIFVLPTSAYVSLQPALPQISDESSDIVYYSLRRFLELASGANPNILELLYLPEDCILYRDPLFERLLEKRACFISKQVYQSHIGYATGQIKKARGKNKWINNPQPKEKPSKDAFCWYIPKTQGTANQPLRPVPIAEAGIDLKQCRVAAVSPIKGLYRLYQYPYETKGVFRDGHLVCDSIALEDEAKTCIGLFCFQEEAYSQAMRSHRQYWQWIEARNPNRWKAQETGRLDYDAKNIMHCFRLVMSGSHILEQGIPLVRFSGERLQFLKNILAGSFSYDELMTRLEDDLDALGSLYQKSDLPETSNLDEISDLLADITQQWEARHA